ncbi:hypothetical protein DXG01_007326 [Tephrocybe rancida]|nr:hypothetical protein DXG01_007326 [Tephrocybe rancida]
MNTTSCSTAAEAYCKMYNLWKRLSPLEAAAMSESDSAYTANNPPGAGLETRPDDHPDTSGTVIPVLYTPTDGEALGAHALLHTPIANEDYTFAAESSQLSQSGNELLEATPTSFTPPLGSPPATLINDAPDVFYTDTLFKTIHHACPIWDEIFSVSGGISNAESLTTPGVFPPIGVDVQRSIWNLRQSHQEVASRYANSDPVLLSSASDPNSARPWTGPEKIALSVFIGPSHPLTGQLAYLISTQRLAVIRSVLSRIQEAMDTDGIPANPSRYSTTAGDNPASLLQAVIAHIRMSLSLYGEPRMDVCLPLLHLQNKYILSNILLNTLENPVNYTGGIFDYVYLREAVLGMYSLCRHPLTAFTDLREHLPYRCSEAPGFSSHVIVVSPPQPFFILPLAYITKISGLLDFWAVELLMPIMQGTLTNGAMQPTILDFSVPHTLAVFCGYQDRASAHALKFLNTTVSKPKAHQHRVPLTSRTTTPKMHPVNILFGTTLLEPHWFSGLVTEKTMWRSIPNVTNVDPGTDIRNPDSQHPTWTRYKLCVEQERRDCDLNAKHFRLLCTNDAQLYGHFRPDSTSFEAL